MRFAALSGDGEPYRASGIRKGARGSAQSLPRIAGRRFAVAAI